MPSKPQASPPVGLHYAFLIVAGCIAITCLPCALVLSCAGIFFKPVSAYFGVSQASFTLYFSVLNLAMMLTLPVAGRLLGSRDVRLVLSCCVALCGLGEIAMSACQEVWQFYLCGAVLGIGVAPLIYLAVPTLVNAWCVTRVGFFVGLCMSFTGIGGVIFNPIGSALISSGPEGWRGAYLLFGTIILVGTLPFTLLVLRGNPAEKGLLPYGAGAAEESGMAAHDGGVLAREAMRTRTFLALLAFCGIITLNQTIYQYLAGYAQSFSQSLPQVAEAAGIVASAAMAGQALGKVLLGVINDRSVRAGVLFGVGSGISGVLLIWLAPGSLALLLAGAFLFGIVYAMTTVQTPMLVRGAFGSADYANIYSRISMVGSLMSAIAAVFWSLVIDSAGGYPLMFALGCVCMLACAILGIFALSDGRVALRQRPPV